MPTKNTRITFMVSEDVAKKLDAIFERPENRRIGKSELIRRLIMKALVADEEAEGRQWS